MDQFARFGAGIVLQRPGEIAEIPALLSKNQPNDTVRDAVWNVASPDHIRNLLVGGNSSDDERTPHPRGLR